MPLLEIVTLRDVAEVDHGAVELRAAGGEHILPASRRSHRLGRDVAGRFSPKRLNVASDRSGVGPVVGEHLSKRRFGGFSHVDAAETPIGIVEAVRPRAQRRRRERERVGVIPDPPVLRMTGVARPSHVWKAAAWRAARMSWVNTALESASRSSSIGAWSSRRVLVPNSHARAVAAS